jgi:hypothetical protein
LQGTLRPIDTRISTLQRERDYIITPDDPITQEELDLVAKRQQTLKTLDSLGTVNSRLAKEALDYAKGKMDFTQPEEEQTGRRRRRRGTPADTTGTARPRLPLDDL